MGKRDKMEHPILFNGEMVRTILEGRKTQTRRPIGGFDSGDNFVKIDGNITVFEDKILNAFDPENAPYLMGVKNPFGKVGDRLWVRESLRRYKRLPFLEEKFPNLALEEVPKNKQKWTAQYMATDTAVPYSPGAKEGWCGTALWQWKNTACPSIHMPRWACRLVLEITNIRVEKLQHISIDDIEKEGLYKFCGYPNDEGSYIHQFVNLWDSIYIKSGYSWEKNPWVWAVDFKVI